MYARCLPYVIAVALAVLCSMTSLQADDCASTYPWYFDPVKSCATNAGGLCAIGAAVSFEIRQYYGSADRRHCATVTWDFGDGTPPVTAKGTELVQHAFAAAGRYVVKAEITTSGYPHSRTTQVVVEVGNGSVSVDSRGGVTEGDPLHVSIVRTNVVGDSAVTWRLRTREGGPIQDVTPTEGTVTIPAGTTTATLTLNTLEDDVFTGQRARLIELTSATGGYLLPDSPDTFYISDDDEAVIAFADEKIVVAENAGVAAIRLRRTGDLSRRNVIQYEVAGPGVVRVAASAVFEPGTAETSFEFAVINDTVWQPRKPEVRVWTYEGGVRLSNGYSSMSRTITITDDDPPRRVDLGSRNVLEGNAGSKIVELSIVLSSPAVEPIELRCLVSGGTASAGRDYEGGHRYVEFRRGDTEKTITLTIFGDDEIEADETVLVTLSDTYWTSGRVVLPDMPLVFTILNDDAGLGPERLLVPQGGRESAFVDLGSPTATDLVIPLVSADPAAIEVPASVTVPAGKTRAVFEVTGHLAGTWAQVTARFPDPLGEKQIKAEVYEPATLILDPNAIDAHPGQEITVRATLDPPAGTKRVVTLQAINAGIAAVPQTVEIPAGGAGTFVVKALAIGWTSITATLPDENGGGSRTLDVSVQTSPDAPALRSVVPSTGPSAGGTRFEAYGAHLGAGCTIRFGGAPATGLVLANDGLLTGVTPEHTAGTVDVVLTCGGQTSTLANGFTYIAATPTLSSVTPSFGSTAGGTHVRVTGTNIRSGCWLFFGGNASPAVETNGTTEITGVTPPRANAGAVEVALRCTGASAGLPAAFAYTNADEPSASIISIAPLAGAPGESVTITGSRFRPGDRVTFDAAPAAILRTAPDSHVIRVPELPLGTSSITLTDAAGRATTTGPIFAVLEPERPQIVSVSPSMAVAGSEIVLTGRAFRPAYSFAAGSPAQTVDLSFERVVIRLASDLEPGVYPIHLRNAAGQLAIVGPSIVVGTQGVSIRAVDPGCGSSDGGAEVTIHGSGFAAGAAVAFNGVAASNVEVVSPAQIRAVAPAGATGPAQITVTNANGDEGTITNVFRYRSPFDPSGCGGPPSRGRSVRH